MSTKRRMYKVAEQLREAVATELFQMADSRFNLVTITSVMISSDLREAKVYWAVTTAQDSKPKDRIAEVEKAFEQAQGYFRSVVGRRMNLRHVPHIRFYYDDTLDTAEEVERLLARIQPAPEEPPKEI